MNKTKIVLVDYFNTLPFLSALKNSGFEQFDIVPAIPSRCSELFFEGDADIALVPAASWVAHGSKERVITDYCIGCDGEVATVLLHTNDKLEDIKSIYLDTHSRTSAMLLRILCKEYWDISPDFQQAEVSDLQLSRGEGKLMIGDKVFRDKQKYKYTYDLGSMWKQMTSLPFAFAIWIAKDHVDNQVIEKINDAFRESFANMESLISHCSLAYPDIDLKTYFSKYISYNLSASKKQALHQFERHIQEMLAFH